MADRPKGSNLSWGELLQLPNAQYRASEPNYLQIDTTVLRTEDLSCRASIGRMRLVEVKIGQGRFCSLAKWW